MEIHCITADEAKSRTSTVPPKEIVEITNNCLGNISHEIEKAADNGYKYIIYNVYKEISEKVCALESSKTHFSPNMEMAMHRVTDYLVHIGYMVRSYRSEDELMHRISWGG